MRHNLITDKDIDTAADIGERRCANHSHIAASVVLRPATTLDAESIIEKQREAFKSGDLHEHYVELLKSSEALLHYVTDNVGPTIDWPITVTYEARAADVELQKRLSKLRAIVGCLLEV